MSSNQALMDALTLRQIFIERYSKGEAQRLLTHLQRLSLQLQATISTEYERVRAVRLAQQVAGITQTILDEYGDDMATGLKAFAEAEAQFAQQTLVATTAAEVISPGSLRQIQAAITNKPMRLLAGSTMTEISIDAAAKQFSTAKAKQVAQIVRDAATVGRTTQEVVNDIAELVEGRAKAQAASLVRTSTNHIGNVARSATYEANDDVITGEEFVATLDARTTLTCAGHDGEIFDIGKGPIPPLHWSCRSVRTPVINPEYNLGSEIVGERASADGPVSANVTYGGWLKRQSAEVQDEVLGVERAKLFRSGKLSIGKFTDDTGKVYSLNRLKELNPLAFGGQAVAAKASRTITVSPVSKLSKKAAASKMLAQVNKAASDSRYVLASDGLPLTRFRPERIPRGQTATSVMRQQFGEVKYGKLTDEAASAMTSAAIDANSIAAIYGVQPLRGVKVGASRGANASMGDGVLSINETVMNQRAALVSVKESDAIVERLQKQFDDAKSDLENLRKKTLDVFSEFGGRSAEYNAAVKSFNKERSKAVALQKELGIIKSLVSPVSKWKIGDSLDNRPFSAHSFYDAGVDKLRSTVFHEMGHHIHQQYGVVSAQLYRNPPVEALLSRLYRQKRTVSPTKYSETNPEEWFAENFSLYHMGRDDLVDPVLVDMLESLADGKIDEFERRVFQ